MSQMHSVRLFSFHALFLYLSLAYFAQCQTIKLGALEKISFVEHFTKCNGPVDTSVYQYTNLCVYNYVPNGAPAGWGYQIITCDNTRGQFHIFTGCNHNCTSCKYNNTNTLGCDSSNVDFFFKCHEDYFPDISNDNFVLHNFYDTNCQYSDSFTVVPSGNCLLLETSEFFGYKGSCNDGTPKLEKCDSQNCGDPCFNSSIAPNKCYTKYGWILQCGYENATLIL
eukprot:TRINITY_DN111_c1_g1_i2.p1 TRINITY_DN111_c1_g1~~TRINITY_DN111_c1_g1_i2.p1  ORF type:complete len:224 (-),score=10.43 TRINITY_DN111_c1_g1_i2:19-690(-)